ncbi:hypothetical protein [Pseudomonas costantinii]|uniref:SSU ribosomal protein S2p (SAe) n=1 Tax=Pseudomonas costantinii TaxID=168469 RepID=A0A1S2UXL2_9PSED|nr:hypothetical protein [Pseudomonas costantinii]NVZ21937.1 hypothetical protein [Pseudomonas costantinii]OIN51010.1 SSU ribosomal protein S2p (SAe) [Pseudomonas costantinii]SED88000.1 hypothetical protein SAMN04515675_2949 [Pseudomonas costantinii]
MQGPYAFINDRPRPYPQLKLSLSLSPHTQTKFDTLNQHIRNVVVLPGQLVIIGDSRTASCTAEEAQLMRSAANIKQALLAHSAADQFLIKNYDQLQAIMANASIGIGSASSAWSKHLEAIEKNLKEIDDLHKQYLSKGTTAARDEFLVKRRVLFARLDGQLSGMARSGTGLKNEGSIKKMLGISSKSYWQHGEIRGYEETVKRVAKASQMLKKGTYIGIALDVGATALEITEACSTGREQECTKAKYVEGVKLVGAVGGSYWGGKAGTAIGTGACVVVFGVPTAGIGVLACAIVGGAAGGLAGGALGSGLAEYAGNFIYKTVSN